MKRLLIILFLLPFFVAAQVKKPHISYLTKDSISYYKPLQDNWRFRVADSPAMAAPGYNDSSWALTYPEQYIGDDTSSVVARFKGVMWLRWHFVVDTTLVGVPLAIAMTHLGASEVYVDGKKIGLSGTIKGKDSTIYVDPQLLPMVFQLQSPGEHVMAVRYVNYDAWRNYKIYSKNMPGFRMRLGLASNVIGNERSQTITMVSLLIFLFGVFTALSLLHLLLFLYHRKDRSNLYFSIFSLSLGFVFLLIFQQRFANSPATELRDSFIALLVAMASCFSMSGFSNELFSKNKTRFIVITALCFVFLGCWYYDVMVGIYSYFILIGIVTLESVLLTIRAILRKVRGAKIIGFGILFFGLFFLTIAIFAIFEKNLDINDSTVTGVLIELFGAGAILSIPLSMSVYLAWSFSTMNKDLKKQVEQIKELSDRTLKQEIERKEILELQNQELEQKVNERTYEVQHQKELVEIKNKAITDNLVYAQRIQSAILPDTNLIQKTLTQSFVLYLPKDIVSGDFYLFNKKDDKVVIAAGDCTGHGVSGAFMSMIGSSLLNQIINERAIEEPAQILNHLNTAIIDTLKQTQNESTDGMDIAICSLDLVNGELQFAGANRPLYLIRNNVLEIIKPDKLPIGGLQVSSDRVFSNHIIRLEKNDTIYLFTDGYTDQFGGEKDKKLMVARFKDILLSIQKMDMQEQFKYLATYFGNWKGNNEQVDDVLVIGIRI